MPSYSFFTSRAISHPKLFEPPLHNFMNPLVASRGIWSKTVTLLRPSLSIYSNPPVRSHDLNDSWLEKVFPSHKICFNSSTLFHIESTVSHPKNDRDGIRTHTGKVNGVQARRLRPLGHGITTLHSYITIKMFNTDSLKVCVETDINMAILHDT